MDKIEWETPLLALVPQLRRLQYACNGLSGREFAEAMGWDWEDKYVQNKFLEFQKLGRLGVFDDGVLNKAVLWYERREARYEAARKAADPAEAAIGRLREAGFVVEDDAGLTERVERLEDDTHNDNDSIIKLTLRMQDLEGFVRDLQPRVRNLEERIEALETTVDEVSNETGVTLASLAERIDSLTEQVKAQDSAVDALEAARNDNPWGNYRPKTVES